MSKLTTKRLETSAVGQIARPLIPYRGILIVVGLLLVFLPFAVLSFYNHPTLDDIVDATKVRELGFWQSQKHFYVTHTGRYTTTALLASINPLVYSQQFDWWWMVAVGFIFGTLLVLRLALRTLLEVSAAAAWLGASLLVALWITYAPGQAEGMYWFTGAYTYIVTAWLVLLWLTSLGRYVRAQQAEQAVYGWGGALTVLAVAIAGTTEPIAFPFLLMLGAGALLSTWRGGSKALWLLTVLTAAGTWVSLSAPGNFARISSMGGQFGVLKTISYSAATTGYLLLTWIGNPVLLALSALLLPAFYRLAQQRDRLAVAVLARVPVRLLAAGLVALMAAASCPAYYASGTGLPLRTRNVLHLFFILGWFWVLLTWCCRQVSRNPDPSVLRGLATGRLAPLWTALLALFFFADHNLQTRASMLGQGSNNVIRAYRQWLGGEAAGYDAEMTARYQDLHASAPSVKIYPLHNRPELLYSFDIAETKDTMLLGLYARNFGKKEVVIVDKERQ